MKFLVSASLLTFLSLVAPAQGPMAMQLEIIKAEDARRYDLVLENLMNWPGGELRTRAALAAGRIGDDRAVPALVKVLENDLIENVRVTAAFSLGEIESINAADTILKNLRPDAKQAASVRARLVEAAGKIAVANPKAPKSVELGNAVLDVLKLEDGRAKPQDSLTIRLGLTAVLRARPDGADKIVTKFLTNYDPRVVADAANTMARLRSKGSAEVLRKLVASDIDPLVRANSARALGNMADKDSLNELLSAAIEDKDARVRASGIGAVANLNDPRAAKHLIERGNALLKEMRDMGSPPAKLVRNPPQKNELLLIATALGRLLQNTDNEAAISLLDRVRIDDKYRSPETEVALARISPRAYLDRNTEFLNSYKGDDWHASSAVAQGMSEIAGMESTDSNKDVVREIRFRLLKAAEEWFWTTDEKKIASEYRLAMPDMLRAMGAEKKGDSSGIFRPLLDREKDVFIRATLAELLADQPKSKENTETLIAAFAKALETDEHDNDAQLAILDALYKLDKKEALGSLLRALNARDFIVRKKALQLLDDAELKRQFPESETALRRAKANGIDKVLQYTSGVAEVMPPKRSKLGQILNTEADYRRALSRKDGSVKAVLTTEKGTFTIEFFTEEAPLTVDNFIKLARAGYFNGLEVHRVVPNFVMQDGDPRGDGNGGPGWSIRCEINMLPYDRGAVGMALSGKDTGGSQWFVTHSPQPHLDGGYTVFGHVNETGMKVVDNIVRGDRILSVKIIGR